MKNMVLRLIRSTLLRPPYICCCSQTIYEVLLGCLRLWDATSDQIWKKRATEVCRILLSIQRPDGGFDIGYDFFFGRQHNKGESTAPELVGLLALMEYHYRFGGQDVEEGAHCAAGWIRKHTVRLSEKHWVIPYGPYSTKEVMVYNGTSFAAGALGVYLSVFPDEELTKIYDGMNRYLFDMMRIIPDVPGRFWFYSDQLRDDLTELQRDKIDYYHQMQQVEVHAMADLRQSSPFQADMVCLAADHIAGLQDESGLIPYTNRKDHFGEDLHLWGFCSCAAGFLMAGRVSTARSAAYRVCAIKIYDWIFQNSWNGKYFYPVVNKDGVVTDRRDYVRSDAWVFNAFSLAVLHGIEAKKYLEVCDRCFVWMEQEKFSGIENHAGCFRTKIVSKGLDVLLKLIKRIAI